MEIYSGGVINVEKLLLNYCHPVGSLYISEKSTDPATIFGGTWERIKDKFILAAGDSYSAGSTGGEASHALTQAELPDFEIPYKTNYGINNDNYTSTAEGDSAPKIQAAHKNAFYSTEVTGNVHLGGSGAAHNNMPPYLTMYAWKRTA